MAEFRDFAKGVVVRSATDGASERASADGD